MPRYGRRFRGYSSDGGLRHAGDRADSPEQPETLQQIVFGTGKAAEKPPLSLVHRPIGLKPMAAYERIVVMGREGEIRLEPKRYEHQCVNGAVYSGAFYRAPELSAHHARPQSERYLDAAIALASRKAWEALGWLHTAGPMGTDALVEKLGGSRDAFEAVSRLFLLRMISFDDGKLAVSPLGVKALEEFELIERTG